MPFNICYTPSRAALSCHAFYVPFSLDFYSNEAISWFKFHFLLTLLICAIFFTGTFYLTRISKIFRLLLELYPSEWFNAIFFIRIRSILRCSDFCIFGNSFNVVLLGHRVSPLKLFQGTCSRVYNSDSSMWLRWLEAMPCTLTIICFCVSLNQIIDFCFW